MMTVTVTVTVTVKLKTAAVRQKNSGSVSRMLPAVAMTTLFCGGHVYRITAVRTAIPIKYPSWSQHKTPCLYYLLVEGSTREVICLIPLRTCQLQC